MLSLYQPRRTEDDSSSDGEKVIPAGTPYLTKINGQLVMAREKRDKPSNMAIDLLGEAFGVRTRVIRKRAKSLEGPPAPLLIGGVPHVPQLQLTHTSPIPQQSFHSSSIHMPQYSQHQQLSLPAPKPTQHDFDQLKRIDAHFNNTQRYSSAPMPNSNEEMTSKTTITITKHICANCGRLRSTKYHHEHPIKLGETQVPAFCRKCQKDASSTSDSDSSDDGKGKKKKKGKNKKYEKKANKSSSDDSSRSPEPKKPRKPQPKKKLPRRIPSDELIIVEEEISEEEERLPRGRSHRRVEVAEVIVEEERRPLSPLVSQSTKARSRSTGRHERYSIPRKPVRQQRSQETIYRRALSPRYRYVHGPAASIQADPAETSYPRRIPVHFVEEDIYESAPPSRASHKVHEEAPWQSVPLREYSIDERETASSSRSQEAAQRRRRERSLPNDGIEPPLPPWQQPHIIHPRPGDETIVVTERYVYRPRKASQVEEERRIQERVDKIMLDGRSRTTEFAAEDEASKYYHDDWAHEESARRNESIRRRVPRQRGYRREMHQDSELADSEDSLDFVRTGHRPRHNLPRAPSPQISAISSPPPDIWQDRPPYPVSSDSEAARRIKTAERAKAVQRNTSRSRSRSTARRQYVDEVTNGEMGQVLVPSPKSSRDREFFPDDISERERIVEEETRHFSFREPESPERGAPGGWGESARQESEGGEKGEWDIAGGGNGDLMRGRVS